MDSPQTRWRRASLMPLWESPIAYKADRIPDRGHLWSWSELRPLALAATEIGSPEAVERRVLLMINPYTAAPGQETAVKNLTAGIQILLPGETARPHRHSMNALRFLLEGEGAVTIVDGKSCPMQRGDLILTPAWCWHEHQHHGKDPALWLDGLDVPLHYYLGTARFQPGPMRETPLTTPDAAFISPNMLPETTSPATAHSPVFRYPYANAVLALENAPICADGGRWVRYINPVTGAAPMTTLECRLGQIDAGESTIPYRNNSNSIALVVEGEGETRIGDDVFQWGPNDIFIVPQMNWVTHRALKKTRLFMYSDSEALRRLNLFEEAYRKRGDGTAATRSAIGRVSSDKAGGSV